MSLANWVRTHHSCVPMGIGFHVAAVAGIAGASTTDAAAAPPSLSASRRVSGLAVMNPPMGCILCRSQGPHNGAMPTRGGRLDRDSREQQPAEPERPSFDRPMEARYSIGMPNREQAKADVMQGTLDLMVLQTLSVLGPLHGYAIAARLEQVSGGALQLNMGTLYPALMRLEQRGLLRGNWGTTDHNRKARFYSLTAAGRRELAREKQAWDRMAAIMHALLRDA